MDALVGRCHNRITTCFELGTVTQPDQKLFCIVLNVLWSCVLVQFRNFSITVLIL
jgi:hypothetical protein